MPEPQEPTSQAVPGPATGSPEPIQIIPVHTSQTTPAPPTAPSNTKSDSPQRLPNWLQQVERFLRVIVRIYLGLLVCFAPWYPPAWDANPLFVNYPSILNFISHGAVRGLVSGLGLLNLWIALRDALRNPSETIDTGSR